ncbi:MAG: helix-turn-helix transcriptional regulator [Lachnospiraceae bacterium]|nr:helix-turn-helix transcriptional regulator [Lachnospiraceae bacterium]
MYDFVKCAEEFVEKHLQEEFTLEEIANFCGYSSFHYARKFKEIFKKTVMEYVREERILASAELLKSGFSVCNAAMEYGFETHAGFTKAFRAVLGCCPKDYIVHNSGKYWKGFEDMKESKIIIRSIRQEDVSDLWENVYSAMTPKEILDVKVTPAMERETNKTGVELVAEVDGTVVMTLPMIKPFWIPMGFLFDNNYVITGDGRDELMKKLLEEMMVKCKEMGISTLISPQRSGSESFHAFVSLGFSQAWTSDGWTYLAMAI